MRKLVSLSLLLCLAACTTTQPHTKPAATQGQQRLSPAVQPAAYTVALRVDPAQDHFSGEVTIAFKVSAADQRRVALHADGLTIQTVTLADAAGAAIAARVEPGEGGAIALVPATPLGAGAYTVTMRYEGALDEVPTGLYRVKDGERWYAFTQFEPLDAREAFPCFDEPGFKTPFTLAITAPAGQLAFANYPQASVADAPDGWRTTTFAPTAPLPTYLVAFAVGEFDVIEAPADAVPGVPLRLIATKGKAEQGRWILGQTPAILKVLTDYFGMPYPYAKLDLVAVPNFAAGAMENVGLVTFRDSLLLMDEQSSTPDMRFDARATLAHELAHMWFGDLVTPAWWDDLWLNESFASWMGDRVMARISPELHPELWEVSAMGWLMSADSRAETRAIRQPITGEGDVHNAFDAITYGKGAAVLRMVEAWIGPEVFQAAIQAYMKANAHGQVTSKALFAALEAASDKPVIRVMSSFVDRPGAPLVSLSYVCDGEAATLRLEQRRYLPAGSLAKPATAPWAIPMCLRVVESDGKAQRQCLLFDTSTLDVPLTSCPGWVHPNDGEIGYYHWSVEPERLQEMLLDYDLLTPVEQMGLLTHTDALVAAQLVSPAVAWDATLTLASLPEAPLPVRSRLVGLLGGMEEGARRIGQVDAWRALVRARLSPLLDFVGVEPAEGEDPELVNYRLDLLRVLGNDGRDPFVLATAQAVLAQFLETPDQIPSGRLSWALPMAVESGDVMLWERLQAIALEAKSPAVRSAALRALGYFRDPMLQDYTLTFILDPRLRSNEIWALYGPMMREPFLYARAWTWFKANYPALVAKLGEAGAAGLPGMGRGFCTAEGQADVRAFFEALPTKPAGMERNLSQTLERIGACDVQVNASLDALRAFFAAEAVDASEAPAP
jgi:cytosol alanyl aminopeptidase